MKTVASLLAATALLASPQLAAQATKPLATTCPAPEASATPPTCSVSVLVPGSCGGGIHVHPDPIVTKGPNAVRIQWTVTGGWSFAGDTGIVVRGTKVPESFREYKEAGSTFVILHVPRPGTIFKYDINLRRGDERCTLDPTIVNY